jgi:hypothetical protein
VLGNGTDAIDSSFSSESILLVVQLLFQRFDNSMNDMLASGFSKFGQGSFETATVRASVAKIDCNKKINFQGL